MCLLLWLFNLKKAQRLGFSTPGVPAAVTVLRNSIIDCRLADRKRSVTSGIWTLAGAFLALLLGLVFCTSLATAGEIPTELIRKNERIQAADLVVSARTLTKGINNGQRVTFVDVRQPAEFEALHISGAMNIPLHFIKHKTYLKSVPVVLVDQGLAFHRLAPVCRQLRRQGFQARILDGGMNAWAGHGGHMVGDPVRQMGYQQILPADFFQEKNYTQRLVCDISAKPTSKVKELMPYAVHLPLSGSAEERAARIEKFKTAHARNGAVTLLVVSETGEEYPGIQSALNRAGFENVFYLKGGARSYREYLQGLTLSWQPRETRIATAEKCSQCAEAQGQDEK